MGKVEQNCCEFKVIPINIVGFTHNYRKCRWVRTGAGAHTAYSSGTGITLLTGKSAGV
jgi:hypothetical protein